MKIAFHLNQLDRRGTGVSLYNYAHYNEILLENQSLIISPSESLQPYFHCPIATKNFQERFNVIRYQDYSQLNQSISDNNIDIFYALKGGWRDEVEVNQCKYAVHCVFQFCEPHGDVYAYISDWLAEGVGNNQYPYVPHIVTMPENPNSLRDRLGIPTDALVIGRHGGETSFDIPWAKEVVFEVAKDHPHIYFLFLNTVVFSPPLPNLIHLQPIIDPFLKGCFIETCDAMLHAREQGESFGMAIAEFAYYNKPVITYKGGTDQAHLKYLGDKGLYYSDADGLKELLLNFPSDAPNAGEFFRSNFSPEKVMNKFKKVFIDD